jgi:hypothetical protein
MSKVYEVNQYCRIIIDDGCYLVQHLKVDGSWKSSPWIPPEAHAVLVTLPPPPGPLYDINRDGPLPPMNAQELSAFMASLIGEGKHKG